MAFLEQENTKLKSKLEKCEDELQEYKQEHKEMESLLRDNRIKYVSRLGNR